MDTRKIDKYITAGARDLDWYVRCRAVFAELFGEKNVPVVAKLFAATSINSSLESNVRLFRRAWFEVETDLPVGATGNYLPVMAGQIAKVRAGEELTGNKIRNFAAAIIGDVNAVVVDTWILRAFDEDVRYGTNKRSGGATDWQYMVIEAYIRDKAKRLDLQPRQVCAAIWSGIRTLNTRRSETTYENVLRKQLYNMFTNQITL